MSEMVEIFFRDLNEEGKKKVLEFYEIDNSDDGNFEFIPLVILEKD